MNPKDQLMSFAVVGGGGAGAAPVSLTQEILKRLNAICETVEASNNCLALLEERLFPVPGVSASAGEAKPEPNTVSAKILMTLERLESAALRADDTAQRLRAQI